MKVSKRGLAASAGAASKVMPIRPTERRVPAPRKQTSVLRVPLQFFGHAIGAVTVDLSALAGIVEKADGATIPSSNGNSRDFLKRLRHAIDDGVFNATLESEWFEADLESGVSAGTALPHSRDKRRTNAALRALRGEWGRSGAWVNDASGRKREVDTEPWPALALRFVRRQITHVLLYGTEFERKRLVEVFTAPRGQREKVRGGRPYASELLHFVRAVIGEAAKHPVGQRIAWLSEKHPDIANRLSRMKYAASDVTSDQVDEIAFAVVQEETGYKQKVVGRRKKHAG